MGTVVEAPAQSAQARIVPALDENGDAAGQSSHAAGGVNTELLINKMPPQRWIWAGQVAKTATITTPIGCERRGRQDGGEAQRQWSCWRGGLAASFDGESSTHFHRTDTEAVASYTDGQDQDRKNNPCVFWEKPRHQRLLSQLNRTDNWHGPTAKNRLSTVAQKVEKPPLLCDTNLNWHINKYVLHLCKIFSMKSPALPMAYEEGQGQKKLNASL